MSSENIEISTWPEHSITGCCTVGLLFTPSRTLKVASYPTCEPAYTVVSADSIECCLILTGLYECRRLHSYAAKDFFLEGAVICPSTLQEIYVVKMWRESSLAVLVVAVPDHSLFLPNLAAFWCMGKRWFALQLRSEGGIKHNRSIGVDLSVPLIILTISLNCIQLFGCALFSQIESPYSPVE